MGAVGIQNLTLGNGLGSLRQMQGQSLLSGGNLGARPPSAGLSNPSGSQFSPMLRTGASPLFSSNPSAAGGAMSSLSPSNFNRAPGQLQPNPLNASIPAANGAQAPLFNTNASPGGLPNTPRMLSAPMHQRNQSQTAATLSLFNRAPVAAPTGVDPATTSPAVPSGPVLNSGSPQPARRLSGSSGSVPLFALVNGANRTAGPGSPASPLSANSAQNGGMVSGTGSFRSVLGGSTLLNGGLTSGVNSLRASSPTPAATAAAAAAAGSASDRLCQNCEDTRVQVQCMDCNSSQFLCEDCYGQLHKPAKMASHRKVAVSASAPAASAGTGFFGAPAKPALISPAPSPRAAPTPIAAAVPATLVQPNTPAAPDSARLCDNCEDAAAAVRCGECELTLCDSCSTDVHKPASKRDHDIERLRGAAPAPAAVAGATSDAGSGNKGAVTAQPSSPLPAMARPSTPSSMTATTTAGSPVACRTRAPNRNARPAGIARKARQPASATKRTTPRARDKPRARGGPEVIRLESERGRISGS